MSRRTQIPSRHGVARSEGVLWRASRADGGGSAIIRGTLTPDPAAMEAERAGGVYRVSHVVDGEFVNLLRRCHTTTTILDHYDFAARPLLLRAFLGFDFLGSTSRNKMINKADGFRVPLD
jgi:hypothetical protein